MYANGSAKTVCSSLTSARTAAEAETAAALMSGDVPVRGRRRRAPSPCSSAGSSTAKPSRQPPGEPGRLTTSVARATPATPRERSACGVARDASARIASAMPGASRSSTRPRRLRRHVARREAGAAGREHDGDRRPRDRRSHQRSRRLRRARHAARPRSPPQRAARRAGRRSCPRACPRATPSETVSTAALTRRPPWSSRRA